MPVTMVASRLPLSEMDKKEVRKIFATPGYIKLKEVIQARCIETQVELADLLLYPEHETAAAKAKALRDQAITLNQMLGVLDDLEKNDEWFTVKIDHT